MQEWIKKLNDILIINDNQILEHAGKISCKLANEIVSKEYDKYSKKHTINGR